MQLDPALHDTLASVAQAMRAARRPWWVIGGAAAVLHGVRTASVPDVDVLLDPGDAAGLPIVLAPGQPDALFRSERFGRWSAPPLPVEFMAGLSIRDGSGWAPVALTTRRAVAGYGPPLFIPERHELRALLSRFGRPKDLARAELLAD